MDLLRMSHDNLRMICKNRFQQLQTEILNEIHRREKFRILSISQETNVVQELEGIRRKFLEHVATTYKACIQGRAIN